jgi:hypothetical protein
MRAYHASRRTPKTSVALCRALSLPLLLCLSIIARNAYLNQRPLGSQVAGMQRGLRGIWSFEIHINRTRPVVPDRRDRPRAQYQKAFSNPARAPITPPPFPFGRISFAILGRARIAVRLGGVIGAASSFCTCDRTQLATSPAIGGGQAAHRICHMGKWAGHSQPYKP